MSVPRHPLDRGVQALRYAALARDMERVLREDSEQVPDLTRTWQGRADGHEAKSKRSLRVDRLIGVALWAFMAIGGLVVFGLFLWWLVSTIADAARVGASWAEILERAAG